MIVANKDYYSTREAANLLDVAVSTIQLWANNGLLRAWKTAGGHRRIARESVDEIIAENLAISKNDTQTHISSPVTSQPESISIVIVEDDKQQVRLYKKQFSKLKVKTTLNFAEDGYVGLIKIGSHAPQIIISDLMMPNMDGFKMIDSLDSFPALQDTLKIVVTGLTEDEVSSRGGLPDDVHLFTKPVAFGHLESLIMQKADSLSETGLHLDTTSK